MKTFYNICKKSKSELKVYLETYLAGKGYKVINKDGFLYAKGDVPVLLVAHMDTVHREVCKNITCKNGKLTSPQGIGGDDRCGIYMIMEIIKERKCSVLFCEDEEVGGVGAGKFTKTEFINSLDVNYMIELDRKGSADAVFYRCNNPEFTKFITNGTGFKEAYGSFSDISKLAPAAGIAAVNISSGYYNAHTKEEYVVFDEMTEIIKKVIAIIDKPCDEPFEYIEKKYSFGGGFQQTFNDYVYGNRHSKTSYDTDFDIELEVVYNDENGEEWSATVNGKTKEECWAKFFLMYPEVCFNDISDYSWM